MNVLVDMQGAVYGYLTVIRFSRFDKNRKARWICRCACGKEVEVIGSGLRNGGTKSCGCQKGTMCSIAPLKHGHTVNGKSPEYISWRNMIYRCENPRSDDWSNYGGRGISVCSRWRDSFENFFEDMGPRPKGLTIDRMDCNGNYEPGNCRWATTLEQVLNRRKRTLCLRGHELTEENTELWNGRRRCKTCNKVRQARYRKQRSEAGA